MKPKNTPSQANNLLLMNISISLIIVSFFITILSRSSFNETKFLDALYSVQDTFGVLTGGNNAIGSNDGVHLDSRGFEKTNLRMQPETGLGRIRAMLAPDILNRDAVITYTKNKVTISISSKLIFMRDSHTIRPEMAKTLQTFADVVADQSIPIIVEGHTATTAPQSSGVGDNWDISSRRAMAVVEFLINAGELNPKRLTSYGYAGTKPRHSNLTPKGRTRNNRVDLVMDLSNIENNNLPGLGDKEPTNYNFHGFDFKTTSRPGDGQ